MEKKVYDTYVQILRNELKVALGCTEPIAIAYAGAKVREVLGQMPEHLEVGCSGNIVKNVKAVTVPNSGGQRGIQAAAAMGVIGGDASQELAVLEAVKPADIEKCKALLKTDFVDCNLVENVANLYIDIKATAGEHSAEVEIQDYHSNITKIVKDDQVLLNRDNAAGKEAAPEGPDKSLLNVKDILEFADTVDLKEVQDVLERQIEYNTAISEEGLKHPYGAEIGRTLMEDFDTSKVEVQAKALAAAGSDARMSGCPMPVVINSGSGNQGITVTMPVVVYAKYYHIPQEKLYRALIVSNLISIHQKRYIGSLSAYCGATSAACGSGAGIAYMMGMNYEEISEVITNSIATIGGMACDGAKSSCAAKIAAAVECATVAIHMARKKRAFKSGEGLVKDNVEETIAAIGDMGRVGMKSTDVEILNIMLDKIKPLENKR